MHSLSPSSPNLHSCYIPSMLVPCISSLLPQDSLYLLPFGHDSRCSSRLEFLLPFALQTQDYSFCLSILSFLIIQYNRMHDCILFGETFKQYRSVCIVKTESPREFWPSLALPSLSPAACTPILPVC